MNINEIAELAGVSRATVSRYLNDGYVSEEKRAAIRKVIEDTGYRPSQQARNLRSKVTKLVGVIIPEIESGSVSQMVSGMPITGINTAHFCLRSMAIRRCLMSLDLSRRRKISRKYRKICQSI